MLTATYAKSNATGPRTPRGKAVAGRNATTHGLFARDIVLPSLGEDPEGYGQIQAELNAELNPENLLERHYVEKIAAASWRLRRLHRWQAQIFEDETLTEDERLGKLDKVLRHENHLHRQIDTAVKMLNKDVPQLHTRRAREEAPPGQLPPWSAPPALDYDKLDAVLLPETTEICQNEPLTPASSPAESARDREIAELCKRENERKLATLQYDVSDLNAQGRPIYIDNSLWWHMERQIEFDRPESAASYAEQARLTFLRDQADARALLAAPSGLS
jgi:hypothetical protein